MLVSRVTVVLFLLFSLLSVTSAAQEGERYNGRTVEDGVGARADAYLAIMSRFGYSGVAVMAKDGKICLNEGYGYADFERGVPNGPMTAVLIGSNTKQFTSAAILKLEMMGKLQTDDTLVKFFHDVPEDKRNITLHQLLTHTAGIIEYTGTEEAPGDFDVQTRENAVRTALQAPLLFEPGSSYTYSNSGYSLLAAIVEITSGMSYEEFLNTHLFSPADMHFTGYRGPHWSSLSVAHMHADAEDNGNPLDMPYPYWNLLGNGGMLTVVEDMFRWDQALRGNEILNDAAKLKLYKPEARAYAYGWERIKNEYGDSVTHSGGTPLGAQSYYFRSLDRNSMFFFSINNVISDMPHTNIIRGALLQILFDRPFSLPENIDRTARPDLTAWEGRYSTADGEAFVVEKFGNDYFIAPQGQKLLSMLASEDKETAARHERQTAMGRRIADEMLRGETLALEELNGDNPERVEQLKRSLARRFESVGGAERVYVYGTLDDWWNQSGQDVTFLEVHGPEGSVEFRLHWVEGTRLLGIGGRAVPRPLWLFVVPLRDGSLAAFDPVRGQKGTLKLREDNGSKKLHLMTEDGEIIAERQ